jgi:hypothetical protein
LFLFQFHNYYSFAFLLSLLSLLLFFQLLFLFFLFPLNLPSLSLQLLLSNVLCHLNLKLAPLWLCCSSY